MTTGSKTWVWVLFGFLTYYPAGGLEDITATWSGGTLGDALERARPLIEADSDSERWELVRMGYKDNDFEAMWHWWQPGEGERGAMD